MDPKFVLAAYPTFTRPVLDPFTAKGPPRHHNEMTVYFVALEVGTTRVRNISRSVGENPCKHNVERLAVHAYGATDMGSYWYGSCAPEYRDVFSIELRDAEAMVKTLRHISRAFDRSVKQLGWPTDLAGHAQRTAMALGAKHLVLDADLYEGGSWDRRERKAYSLGAGIDELRRTMERVAKDARKHYEAVT